MKIPSAFQQLRASKEAKPSAPAQDIEKVHDVADKAVETDKPTADADVSNIVDKIDLSWLPFAAKTYKISPNLSDYVIVNIPICPSDIPNRNGIAFPLSELISYQPPPIARMTYKAWTGCPVHVEHDNEDHEKAVGVIFDTSLRRMLYGEGKHYVVYGLIGIDKTKDPETAQRFASGQVNTGSMGALADYFTCSVCGAQVGTNQFTNCPHVTSSDRVNWKIIDYEGQKVVVYLNAHVLSPIEYSVVQDPAWATCLSDMVLAK